jgi:hypothetical protein
MTDLVRLRSRIVRGGPWAGLVAGLLGCGSEVHLADPPPQGSSSSARSASTGGHGGSDGTGFGGLDASGGSGGFGGLGATADPCRSSTAEVALDGEASPFARLEAFWIAPAMFAEICFAHGDPDPLDCNSTLTLQLHWINPGDNPATAYISIAGAPFLASEPAAFVLTILEKSPVTVATFEGPIETGEGMILVTGSLSGCPELTE